MRFPTRGGFGGPRSARWLLATGLAAVIVVGASPPAAGYWAGLGSGTGTAQVATLGPVSVTASVATWATSAALDWTAPVVPAGMSVSGYHVTRDNGSTVVGACASSATSPLPASAGSCVDTNVPDGDYVYTVTALTGSWTTTGSAASVTVARDLVLPTVSVAGTDAVNAHLAPVGGTAQLYYRPAAAGSIRLVATVTDAETGPTSATFPAPAAVGWVHPAETVTSGTGPLPTATYQSTPYTFTAGAVTPAALAVTATDGAANVGQADIVVVADGMAPTGGALSANGTAASGAGTTSVSTSGNFSVTSPSGYAESTTLTSSGLASSELRRSVAPVAAGTCGSFGPAATVTAPITESGLAAGCYRYSLTGTDLVGNVAQISTTVRVDSTAPVGGALPSTGAAGAASETFSEPNPSPAGPLPNRLRRPESIRRTTVLERVAGTCQGSWRRLRSLEPRSRRA